MGIALKRILKIFFYALLAGVSLIASLFLGTSSRHSITQSPLLPTAYADVAGPPSGEGSGEGSAGSVGSGGSEGGGEGSGGGGGGEGCGEGSGGEGEGEGG